MSSNTERIVKNTLFLYLRQIIIMLVSLFTVRIVLKTLGVEDYGIYNIVSGIILFFSFFYNTMINTTQRFLNTAMGQNDDEKVRDVFNISIIIHVIIAFLLLILAETIGIIFFFKVLNIPPERHNAAFFVYHLSVLLSFINILRVPYSSLIFSYEKMSIFAFISVFEAFYKLAIAFLLTSFIFDKLIFYSILLCFGVLIIFFIEKITCNILFKTSHFRICRDKTLYRQMASFSGWSFFTPFAGACQNHGTNIILNIFHGVTLNAAMGISSQVKTAVYSFVSNFQTAYKPQIIKSYASNDFDYFMRLLFQTSKISFYLLFVIILPLFINADFIFNIWLVNIPEYSVIFTRLLLIDIIIMAVSGPLTNAIQAIGDIKHYQIFSSILLFLNLPFSFFLLLFNFNPVWIIIIRIALEFILYIWRVVFLKSKINLSIKTYINGIIFPILLISSISILINLVLYNIFDNLLCLITTTAASIILIIPLIYYIGFNIQERMFIINYLKNKFLKKKDTI